MAETDYKGKRIALIKRVGLMSTVAVVVLLALAACGAADSAGSATGSATGQDSAVATQPTATATGDMGDMATAAPTEDTSANTIDALPATEATATPGAGVGAGTQAGGTTEIQATLREWAIDLSRQEVAAGKITIVVTNQGQFAHNLTVTDAAGTIAKTPNFTASDGPQTLEVELQPGTYTIICNLPGHAARGQKTELVVK